MKILINYSQIYGVMKPHHHNIKQETYSKEKFYSLRNGVTIRDDYFTINDLVKNANNNNFHEPEWGFPKGRRNTFEKDYDCAVREFCEESGFDKNKIYNLQNIRQYMKYLQVLILSLTNTNIL